MAPSAKLRLPSPAYYYSSPRGKLDTGNSAAEYRGHDYAGTCWWCGRNADSREHKFPRALLQMEFGKASGWSGGLAHVVDGEQVLVNGLGSKRAHVPRRSDRLPASASGLSARTRQDIAEALIEPAAHRLLGDDGNGALWIGDVGAEISRSNKTVEAASVISLFDGCA